MSEAHTAVEKDHLRRYILRLRDRQSSGEIEQKSAEIADQVFHLHEYVSARGISCYVSKGSEVNTRLLIRKSLDKGKRVLIPVIKKGDIELFFSETKDLGAELAPGSFEILEPKPEFLRPTSLDAVDLIFVPGIAWDKDGYRLGWGRVNQVPRDQFDLPVDMVVTESRVIRCRH